MQTKTKDSQLNRIASVLSSNSIRLEIAEMAENNELAPGRDYGFARAVIAGQLGKERSGSDDANFFSDRQLSEAIILSVGRPVLLVRNGIIEEARLAEIEKMLKPVRNKLIKPVSAVGRVELSDHDSFDWVGTGFRVDEDLIVTNRHVALEFAERSGESFRFRLNNLGKRIRSRIDFREEYRDLESAEFGIAEILWIAPNTNSAPDVAVLRVNRDPGLPEPLQLSESDVSSGDDIAIVGYPARDSRNDSAIMNNIFGDTYDVKRFAPGKVVGSTKDDWFFTHDATTLSGNSGSCALDISTQMVIGVHFGGSFRKSNYAVKSSTLKQILSRRSWVPVTRGIGYASDETFTETKRTIASMKNRAGYDEEFLGRTVPMPTPGVTHSVLKTGFNRNALPYTHFSIVMSEKRRFPIFTAENLDGSLKKSLKRNDSWGFDPRIPETAQIGHKEFYGPQPFDMGHMVRRENPGWGNTESEAQIGEDDTFVYTNAIPQMPQLNRKSWLSLESYVLENAKTYGFRVCVFTGAMLRDIDETYGGVQVPTDFWKVVVAIDSDTGRLLTSAYILSQEGMMPVEGFRYGAFKTYQVPLERIELGADLSFPDSVKQGDVFESGEIREMIASGRFIEINRAEDIVLAKRVDPS